MNKPMHFQTIADQACPVKYRMATGWLALILPLHLLVNKLKQHSYLSTYYFQIQCLMNIAKRIRNQTDPFPFVFLPAQTIFFFDNSIFPMTHSHKPEGTRTHPKAKTRNIEGFSY